MMSSELPLSIRTLVKKTNLSNNYNNNESNISYRNNNRINVNNKTHKTYDIKGSKLGNKVTLVNVLRVLLIFVCLFWFSWNAYFIIGKYLLYDTIVSLRMEPPEETDFPGITVCGPYVILPDTLEELFKDYKYESVSKAIDTMDPNYNMTVMKTKRKQFSKYEQKAFGKFAAKDIIAFKSLKYKDLIAKCLYNAINLTETELYSIDCLEIAPIVESIYEGRKCFTYFSRLSSFNSSKANLKMYYDLNPNIEVTVKMKDNLWALSAHDQQVIVTVHPNSIIPTHLDFDYFGVNKLYYFDVYFTKKSSFLKKKPWKTGCEDYTDDLGWKIREECVNHCIKQFSYSRYNCSNYYGVLTEELFDVNDKICQKNFQNYTVYIEARRFCANQCPPECIQTIYEIYGNVIEILDTKSCVNEEDSGCNATISIKIHPRSFTFINHTEAFSTEEFIGTIGGHMGIWLGLSVIALFDLILKFIEIIKVKFYKKKYSLN